MVSALRSLALGFAVSAATMAVAGLVQVRTIPLQLPLSSSVYLPDIAIDSAERVTITFAGTSIAATMDRTSPMYFVAERGGHSLEMRSWIIGCRVVPLSTVWVIDSRTWTSR
jgi:hypothetical protein